MAKNENEKINQMSGAVLAGSAMIGVGIGFLTDQVVAGAVLGAGVGFILAASVRAFGK